MAVTKSHVFAALLMGLLGGLGCAVEMSEDTYGAASNCAPTTAELSDFETIVQPFLLTSSCATCHSSNSPVVAKFIIQDATDATTVKRNFCLADSKGTKLSTSLTTPGGHPGGTYNAADVQILIDWVNR